jgi:hypothetical protein
MRSSVPLLRAEGQTKWIRSKSYTVLGLSTIGVFLTICSFLLMSPKKLQSRETLMQGPAAMSTNLEWEKKGLGRTLGFAEGYGRLNIVTATVPKTMERPKRFHSSGIISEQQNILKQHAADLSKV